MIVAHGDCGGRGDNLLARELARRIRLSKRYDDVQVGFMRCDPSIEDVAARIACENIRLYPLFLSDGYYVREAIPKRLAIAGGIDKAGRHVTIETPLGLNEKLPAVLAQAASAASASRGIDPAMVNVLLVAHGSAQSPHSADVANTIARGIAAAGHFAKVRTCFLEEPPLFGDELERATDPTLVLGLFAGGGLHAEEDVLQAVKALGRPQVFSLEQLGGYANIIELLHAELAASRPPPAA